ncbi:MAG: cation diffusion facilitator family transporter [Flavobacteriales bacterium]|nr:cation diffusion facilitator family transporter [Flavobacteriales bacterium]
MHQHNHHHIHINENKAKVVVIITAIVMVGEIGIGYWTNSVSLLTDGWHMAAHVLSIGLTWFAYAFARRNKRKKLFSDDQNLFALAGYTSAIILLIVSMLMFAESIGRLLHPEEIEFDNALKMAILGLIVNGVSAYILHHKEEHRDHNIHAAYLHVLADVITSITAIVALYVGKKYNIFWLDSISGILSAFIIANWAIKLALNSGKEILKYKNQKSNDHKHEHSHEHTH